MADQTGRELRKAERTLNRRNPGDCIGPGCMCDESLRGCWGDAEVVDHLHVPALEQPHSQKHVHAHSHAVGKQRLALVLAITAVFMVIEVVGGLLANSLALLADGAHMLTDVASLGLSLFVLWFSRRPARPEKTYGYLRLEILAALVNGVALVVIAGGIFWEAYQRMRTPPEVRGALMIGVALAGLIVNVIAARLLHSSAEHSLNMRGAYLHVLGDLIGSLGAVIAGVLILTTGLLIMDPIISVLVAVLILISSWKIVREAVDVLLESTPAHIDLAELRKAIDGIPGVDDVHDLHVWTVTSGYLAMSGHAVVHEAEQNQRILQQIHREMHQNFGIAHVTVQLERPQA